MRRTASRQTANSTAAWLFSLTIVGYPIFGLLSSLLDVNSTVTSLPFRIGVVILTLVLWRGSPAPTLWWRHHRWLLLFWGLYLARLIWDLLIAGLPGVAEALTFFCLTALFPAIVLGQNAKRFDEHGAARLIMLLGSFVCAAAVTMHIFKLGQARAFTEITDRIYFEALNPISLGHAAVSTLIAALCVTRQRIRPPTLVFAIASAVVAGFCIIMSGSRGPVLALGICATIFVAATGRWVWLVLIALLVVPQALNTEGELWIRFSSVGEDDSALARLILQGNAIQQFLSHPIAGSAYIELEFNEYPHNLFIEAAMSLGAGGLALILVIVAKALRLAIQQLKAGQLLIPLLFSQYLVAAQFSGAIWGNAALWVASALLLAPQFSARRFKRKRKKPNVPRWRHHQFTAPI